MAVIDVEDLETNHSISDFTRVLLIMNTHLRSQYFHLRLYLSPPLIPPGSGFSCQDGFHVIPQFIYINNTIVVLIKKHTHFCPHFLWSALTGTNSQKIVIENCNVNMKIQFQSNLKTKKYQMQRQTVKHVFEPPVQNIRQFETALHREWQQLSQQDIQCLTGGMRRRIEAVIQARGGYTRY